MINISELMLKIYRLQGTHKLDKEIGLYSKHNRYMIKSASEFMMTQGQFIKAFKSKKLPGLSRFDYSYYSSSPTMPVAPAKVLEECFYAYLYHKNHRSSIIYTCPLTGDMTPLIDGYFSSDLSLSESVIKTIEKYYGKWEDEVEYMIIDFLYGVRIELDYFYNIDLNSPFFIIEKGPSFKEIRYDLAMKSVMEQEKEESYEYTGIEEE